MTKGIILSGGWGTRLRPLTCTLPKTLIPIVNKPVIERQILLLKEAGVKEIVLAVSVMSDALKYYFKNGEKLGIKIHYTSERHPMGTAGAIKLAEVYLNDDNFFMLNGDVMMNFSFKDMLDFHVKHGGKGTIASKIVDDPSPYGVLLAEENTNQIVKFQEKDEYCPPGGKCVPMPINAGVYILEPEIFSYIPKNKKVSIERDVFPQLAEKKALYHYPIAGIWKDIGKPDDLLAANVLLLKDLLKKLGGDIPNLIEKTVKLEGKVELIPPVAIGENTIIKNKCKIGPNVIIGNNVVIEENSVISNSLIFNYTDISKNARIEYSIISDECIIQKDVLLKGNPQGLVILAACVEVLQDIKIITPKDKPITVCHHEVVKLSVE